MEVVNHDEISFLLLDRLGIQLQAGAEAPASGLFAFIC